LIAAVFYNFLKRVAYFVVITLSEEYNSLPKVPPTFTISKVIRGEQNAPFLTKIKAVKD